MSHDAKASLRQNGSVTDADRKPVVTAAFEQVGKHSGTKHDEERQTIEKKMPPAALGIKTASRMISAATSSGACCQRSEFAATADK